MIFLNEAKKNNTNLKDKYQKHFKDNFKKFFGRDAKDGDLAGLSDDEKAKLFKTLDKSWTSAEEAKKTGKKQGPTGAK
jgi:hypothetical protein